MNAAKVQHHPSDHESPSSKPWLLCLLIVIVCWLVYANGLHNEFVFDDQFTVTQNEAVRTFDFAGIFRKWYRPMRDLSLALDYWMWGLNPLGFRLTNVLIHSLNSCLVFLLALKVARDVRAALLAALIFAVHPVQTDAVTYISGRRDVLFTLFYLASLYSFIRFREERQWRWALGSLMGFALSLLTKEMAATLPAILFLWDFFIRWEPNAEEPLWRQLKRRAWDVVNDHRWLFVTSGVLLIGFVAVSFIQGHGFGSPRARKLDYWGGSVWSNFLTVLTVHAHYLKLLVWPVELIASYQGAFPIAHSLTEWRVVASFILLSGLFGLMVFCLQRDRIISLAPAFYFITLLPVSHIIPHHELLAEHYLYLPMFGFALLLGRVLIRLSQVSREWSWSVYASAVLIIMAFSARAVARNQDWTNSYTLWQATYQSAPTSLRAAYNMGVEHLSRKEIAQAIICLERAIDLDPFHLHAHNNLSVAYLAQGKPEQALPVLRAALQIQLSPRERPAQRAWKKIYPTIYRNVARCYLELGQPEQALPEVERAMSLDFDNAANVSLLAQVYEALGRTADAIQTCQQGLTRNPRSEELQRILARLLARQK
jgi:Tfp pilus assembly protein PilF